MYHDVMIQNQVWVIIPIPKCKTPINHEIQLLFMLFKYENLFVGVCVCVCTYEIFPWPRTVKSCIDSI